MGKLKYLTVLVSLFCVTFSWNISSSVANSTDFNLVQTKGDAKIITGNETLIFSNEETRFRHLEVNFTPANSNDGEILVQKVTPARRKTKSDEMKSQIAELLSKFKSAAIKKSTSIEEFDNEFEVSATTLPTSGSQPSPSETMDVELEAKAKMSNIVTQNNAPEKTRKPVKLNLKQGLIMNQILGVYGLNDARSSLCNEHVSEFKIGLRALEPWAIKMFDASSKLMSGVTGGNLAELGSFNQCLDIYEETIYGPIKGQHCTLNIHPTDELVKIILRYRKKVSLKHYMNLKNNVLDNVRLTWSVCVPHSCSYEDVLRHFNKSIADVTEGLNLTLSLTKEHCMTVDDLPHITTGDYIYIFVVGLLILVAVISTVIDVLIEDCTSEIVNLFSLKRNAELLFSTTKGSDEITCLYGLRCFSMYFIVYGHRYTNNMLTPLVNYMDLVDWLETYYSTTVHSNTMTVDTFLVISATLLSYTFFNMLSRGIRVNMFLLYLNRHLRLMVPLALAVSTHATVVKHFGSGPLYRDLYSYYNLTCGYFWWTVMLYIQPFVNPRFLCIIPTWYLSTDMFWYYFSPPVLSIVARSQYAGYLVLICLYMGTTISNFSVAWIYKFNGQMPVSPNILQSDYFARYYTQPVLRGGPYILGLIFGHILFKTKNQKIKISAFTQVAGWFMSLICLPSITLISRYFRVDGSEYNRLLTSLFLSCHRSVWTLCIMWIIWTCHHGYGGIVNIILSCNAFKILGRLCYNIFLFHYLFQSVMASSKKTPTYFSNFLSTFDSVGDFAVTSFLAIPLTLCFEYPFTRMCGLLFKSKTMRNTIKVKPAKS